MFSLRRSHARASKPRLSSPAGQHKRNSDALRRIGADMEGCVDNTPLKLDGSALRFGLALEAKASAQGRVSGLASPFGGEPDAYGDVIAPGAYAASLARHKSENTVPVMLWGHDTARIVGRWDELHERADGLHVGGQLNLATTNGREAFEHLRAGDLSGLSIGFRVPSGGASVDYKTGVRTLMEIDLAEISLVALPANRRARVQSVKSIGGPDELRDLLRSHGLPHRFCEKVAAGGWAALDGKSIEDLEAEAKAAAETETMAKLAAMLRETAEKI